MTYHCGIGPGMAALGFAERPPHVRCDGPGCAAFVAANGDHAPRWLRDNKPPRGWWLFREDGPEGLVRIDLCPEHRPREPGDATR